MTEDRRAAGQALRGLLAEEVLRALAADFSAHGAVALERVREEQPAAYLKIFAGLLPRDLRVEQDGITDGLDAGERAALRAALEAARDSRPARASGAAPPSPGRAGLPRRATADRARPDRKRKAAVDGAKVG